jgi:predicted GIY-YIG superfamily endonuclease
MINNGYSNSFVDKKIQNFLDHIEEPKHLNNSNIGQTKNLYYCNQFHNNYLADERALKKIIRDNVKPVKNEDRLSLIVYYQNRKTKDLVIKNNISAKNVRELSKTNLIYQFNCPHYECVHSNNDNSVYIGYTTCTLSRRLTNHLQSGSIKEHFESTHNSKITRAEIVDNTTIRFFERDTSRLRILEALVIKFEKPSINSQFTGFTRTLSLFKN